LYLTKLRLPNVGLKFVFIKVNKKYLIMFKAPIIPTILIAAVTSISTFALSKKYIFNDVPLPASSQKNTFAKQASYTPDQGGYTNFTFAAEKSVPAVVHIEVSTKGKLVDGQGSQGGGFFEQFFGDQRSYIPPSQGSGSGVIISKDGYIVTNNHVVENAEVLKVTTSEKQVFTAKVIGKDPSSDLAVLKIEGANFPYLSYGNSDNVRLGEWVLAVGYPLNLEATVTAGIISAKSRSIGVNNRKSDSPIESFLQTDAAVNPGNSGGALVNSNGDLIGINSAIASPTGSYAGYSYAIPVNIVKKIVDDLMKFGAVQRAFIGITPVDADAAGSPEERSAYNLTKENGIYVQNVQPNSGAEDAGIKRGDFITKINNVAVNNYPQLTEQVSRYRPGDEVKISIIRDKVEKLFSVKLKNKNGNTSVVKNDYLSKLGVQMRPITNDEIRKTGINGGLLVIKLENGAIVNQTKIKPGFVITQVNGDNVSTLESLSAKLAESQGKIEISGTYPGYQGVYYYNLSVD
jgi:serine protease Do